MMEKKEILRLLNHNYNMNFTKVEFYRDGGNLAYVVFLNDKKFFLRVIRPIFQEIALQSIDIQLYLQLNNFPVPTIIFTKDNQPFIQKKNFDGTDMLVLYEYIEGEEPSEEDVENVGELIGKLHLLMKSYPRRLERRDKHFFIERYIDILQQKNYSKIDEYIEIGEKLWKKVKDIPRGYCHGDLYRGNILKAKDNQLYVLDFDTSCEAFPIHDITLFCNETNYFEYSDEGFEKSEEWFRIFLKGYLKFCTLTEKEIEAFYFFHAIYHYQLQATIVEIHGIDCNESDFEDKQLEWIKSWLNKAGGL